MASANCGLIWSQTFTFDAFGNINKSGNSSFSASYSPTTNQMTSIGGSSPSYDANGNVTNDFLHTYAWDEYGRPVTIDAVGVTYDALGRMVEQNRSGTYTEIAYAEDWITAGWGKGMIMLGRAASEDPGAKELAAWIGSFLTDVPVTGIAVGEPFSYVPSHKA